jgi:hypothetical protein
MTNPYSISAGTGGNITAMLQRSVSGDLGIIFFVFELD